MSQTSFHFFKPNELPERLKLNENVTEPTYNDQSVLSLALKAEMNTNHSQKTGSNYTMLGLERTERNPDAEGLYCDNYLIFSRRVITKDILLKMP